MEYHIVLEGAPIPWKRAGINSRGKEMTIYDKQYFEKKCAREEMRKQFLCEPLKGPVAISITFHMPIPTGTSQTARRKMIEGDKQHDRKPDVDNLLKYIFDAMNGVIFVDDSQICLVNARKIYSDSPRTEMRIVSTIEDVA